MSHVLTASGPHHDNLEQTTTQTWWNPFPDHWFWSNPGEKTQEPTPATKGKECHAKRVLWLGAEWPETRAARSTNSKWNGGWMCGICHCCSLPHAPSGKSKVLGSLSDCTCGSNRAVVHTVHVPWRHSACLKGMSMGVIMQSMCLGLSFLLLGSSLGADCSNEKDL